jgi:hypothetical protein
MLVVTINYNPTARLGAMAEKSTGSREVAAQRRA